MHAIKLFGPRDLRMVDEPKPAADAGDILLRMEAVGVCGSDLHYYEEGRIGDVRMTEPIILGHEFAGVVEEAGPGAPQSLVGKRVAVEPGRSCGVCEHCIQGHYNVCPRMAFPGGPGHDGALCEYMTVPAAMCFPVPDSMSAETAAAMEPLAVAIYSVELASFTPGDTVAILGLGPIGLMIALVAKASGAGTIYGTDLHPYRLEAARKAGIDHVFNASNEDSVQSIKDATGGRGVDVAIDAARSSETMGIAAMVARPGGRCVLTGISGEVNDPLPVSDARRKGLEIRWCRRFRHNYPRAIALVESKRLDLSPVLTHTFPLDQTTVAFELFAHARDSVLKATILVDQ